MDRIGLLARAMIRGRWGGLVAVGLLAGVVGGALLVSFGVARRTSTAFDRLVVATHMEDVRVMSALGPEATDALVDLPGISRYWVGDGMVGQLEGDALSYISVLAGPSRDASLHQPLVVEGRASNPDAVDELTVNERFANASGLGVGDTVTVDFLTYEQFLAFDTGFGDPEGPEVTFEVVGVTREPAPAGGIAPVEATPAFDEMYGQQGLNIQFVRADLEGGADAVPAFQRSVAELSARLQQEADHNPEAAEVGVFQVSVPSAEAAEPVAATSRVLVTGLLVAAVVIALAGGTAVVQVLIRRHAAEEQGRRIESALGLTFTDQLWTRLVTGTIPAVVAAITAVVIGFAASGLGPLGSLASFEPAPGRAPHWVILGVGGVAVLVAVSVLDLFAFALVSRSGRRRRVTTRRSQVAAAVTGTAPAIDVGVDFAFDRRGSRAAIAIRSARIGAIVGVAGVVATLVFANSLDRLSDSPPRWGWQADLAVADTVDDDIIELLADERVTALAEGGSSAVLIDGDEVAASAFDVRRGTVGWTMLDGRQPASPEEVVVGSKLADDRGLGIDSSLVVAETDDAGLPTGATRDLKVVGVGVGPKATSEPFGDAILLTDEGLQETQVRDRYRSAYLVLAPGAHDSFMADYGTRLEVLDPERPQEIENLADLGALPLILGVFLGVVAVAALANALIVAVRQRRRDIGTLRAMGMSRRDVRESICVAGMSIATVGIVVGLPLGVVVGGTMWRVVAMRAFVDGDPALTWWLAIVPLGAIVIGALVSLVPGWRAAHQPPAWSLRTE